MLYILQLITGVGGGRVVTARTWCSLRPGFKFPSKQLTIFNNDRVEENNPHAVQIINQSYLSEFSQD